MAVTITLGEKSKLGFINGSTPSLDVDA